MFSTTRVTSSKKDSAEHKTEIQALVELESEARNKRQQPERLNLQFLI